MSDLQPMMKPRSIAVVGASVTSGYGGLVFANVVRSGFKGQLFPVNPKYPQIAGYACYPSLGEIPQDIDCAVLAIRADRVLPTLEGIPKGKVKTALVLTSGFAEVGPEGKSLQAQLRGLALEKGLRIHGPNCMGIINFRDGISLYSGPVPERPRLGRVGVVSQSGALSVCLMWALYERRVGLNYLISSGNEVDLEAAEYIEYMLHDPDVDAVACYVEGFKDPAQLLRAAELAVCQGKPIIVLKVGRSEKGQRSALAHTGALAGDDRVLDAVLKQKGVVRVGDLNELVETTELFARVRTLPRGNRLGVFCGSGGEASMLSDVASDLKLQIPDLTEETREKLKPLIPSFITVANPLDTAGGGPAGAAIIHTGETREFVECLEVFAQDPNIDLVVVSQDAFNRQSASGPLKTQLMVNVASAVGEASARSDKPLILLSCLSGGLSDEIYDAVQARYPLLQGAREGMAAIRYLLDFARLKAARADGHSPGKAETVLDHARVLALIPAQRQVLTGQESLNLLSAYGIPVARGRVAQSADEAVEVAQTLGYPVTLKVESPQIMHKTEAQALRLGLTSELEVRKAYEEVLQKARAYAPQSEIQGILVQEMLYGGTEFIVGTATDAQFGPIVLVGPGGIFVELFKDISVRVPPLTHEDAAAMVREIRASQILTGFRGRPKLDVDALIDALLKLSRLALDLGDSIRELDINPLLVLPEGKGVKAVDALVVLHQSGAAMTCHS